ncbi:MAG: helix-turn-helix domain-containing protein [Oscillospiraceae bacterium]|nr:helix-turn-helix domain-containing protein [Oscillospiraceae bacterium]
MPIIDENLVRLGTHVRQIRKGRRLSQQKLADMSGLAVRTISKIERGKMNPSYEVLSTLVTVLGISFDSLFTFSNDQADIDIQEIASLYRTCPEKGRHMVLAAVRVMVNEMPRADGADAQK